MHHLFRTLYQAREGWVGTGHVGSGRWRQSQGWLWGKEGITGTKREARRQGQGRRGKKGQIQGQGAGQEGKTLCPAWHC